MQRLERWVWRARRWLVELALTPVQRTYILFVTVPTILYCAHIKATYHLSFIIYHHVGIVMFLVGKNHLSTIVSIKSEQEKK